MDWSKRRSLLREIALGGAPTGVAEEAPAAPLGKRSHLRKGTTAINQSTKGLVLLHSKAQELPAA
ncbi:hypothetical protein FZC74_18350 [Sutcliffiella horikoshii]|uniref:Uncharacterized protein n=1 Tax=Sutcliffiella horikoshii TaxID=79883 RepID=A0AA95B5Q6_9BACI|nr:hypothetical protein FZC74_18350 [Sutcliffiella horikoshii]